MRLALDLDGVRLSSTRFILAQPYIVFPATQCRARGQKCTFCNPLFGEHLPENNATSPLGHLWTRNDVQGSGGIRNTPLLTNAPHGPLL